MNKLYLCSALVFMLLASAALAAEKPEYVVGVKGMT